MFKNFDLTKKIICLCLALCLAFGLMGCNPKDTDETQSQSSDTSVSSDESDVTEDTPSEEDTAENDDEFSDEEYQDDEWIEEEEGDEYGDDWVVPLKVYNAGKPVIDTYRGMSATVYHAFGFMKDDKSGRAYTDDMLELEIDRLQKMGVRTCRTKVNTPWLWSETTNNWNLDSVRANYLYDYCKELQSRDMNIVMQLGWDVEFVIEIVKGGENAQQEAKYLDGRGEDRNGESAGYDLSGLDEYWTRVTKAAYRWGYLYVNLLNEMRARGINNIDYLMFFCEPSNRNADGSYHPDGPGASAEEYTKLCRIIKDYLVEKKVLNGILTMGGAQGGNSHELLNYILDTDPDVFEIHACHTYPTANFITDNTYHDYAGEYFTRVIGTMKDHGVFGKKEYWCDEFSARDSVVNNNRMVPDEHPWYGLQGVVGAISAQSFGVSNIISWQAADQLWTDQTNTGGEFDNGIHMCGAMPSLFNSDVPRGEYYMWGLFSKYNGYKNGKVYGTNYIEKVVDIDEDTGEIYENTLDVLSGLHIGAVQLENGGWTITVVNADSIQDRWFTVDFEKSLGGVTLYRHSENVNTCVRNTGAVIADVDKVYVGVNGAFKDFLPAGTVAVYTTEKG
ncbi:MAG: hypothetical protein E7551_00795 [Ruminococcaceae bacterium]|nr:hypothetical protein [Oscillospiraceae bacterium]